jgi:DNA replication protein DnaC
MEININEIFNIPSLLPLKDDEYEVAGMPYCKRCRTPRFVVVKTTKQYIIRTNCECLEAERLRKLNEERAEKRKNAFRRQQKLATMGEKYLNASFLNAQITKNNQKAYESAENFVKNATEVRKNGIGLYIYGDNSSGKTYLTACMCNALVEKGYKCLFTSIPKLIEKYRESKTSQGEILADISSKQFVFIDDLGKEFIGSRDDWEWARAEKLLLDVLNVIYNNGISVIFTSNYSLGDFATRFKLDKAIVERVNEMATKVIKLEGDNFRDVRLEEKTKIADDLGI